MSRERLPDTRKSVTHKAVIRGEATVCPNCEHVLRDGRTKFFFTVGEYTDGRPGELFLHMDEAGGTLDGFADSFGTAISLLLQEQVSIDALAAKFRNQKFEPRGWIEKPEPGDIKQAESVVDYVIGWMANRYGEKDESTRSTQPGNEGAVTDGIGTNHAGDTE